MKTFKVTKAKTQTFKPTNIKSLTEFNGAIAAGVAGSGGGEQDENCARAAADKAGLTITRSH